MRNNSKIVFGSIAVFFGFMIAICLVCSSIFSLFVSDAKNYCRVELKGNNELLFKYTSNFDAGSGTTVYLNGIENSIVITDSSLYKPKGSAKYFTRFVPENFCDEINVQKSGDMYLVGSSFLVQEDGEFFLNESDLLDLLAERAVSKYQDYGDIYLNVGNGISITLDGTEITASGFTLVRRSDYKDIGTLSFTIDYYKSEKPSTKDMLWEMGELELKD